MKRDEFLECMAWGGTGVVYGLTNHGLIGRSLADASVKPLSAATRTFVQISDSHIGFNGKANDDVIATFQQAIDKINALPVAPEFVIHTGDLTHLSKPDQLDTVKQMLGTIKTGAFYAVPGEHDVINDNGDQFFKLFGRGNSQRWFSFDAAGVHSLALTNVVGITKGGILGRDQLEWARADLAKQSPDTPIAVMAHIPLYAVYPDWGWTTDDQSELLDMLRRFDSVTVLNGHIHQVLSKTDGKITFYTAASTAFPQPAPGSAPKPGPLTVPAGELAKLLGIRTVNIVEGSHQIAVVDESLAKQN
ncbi:MAG TPA: metallophosphoesterase [Candidatus Eremiobacteraceae bacterium]|nr:metallophosphoesterase [Candidatus Eremiobacteraceae bacterium]